MAGAAAIVSVETSAKANEYGVELNYGTSIHKIQYGIRVSVRWIYVKHLTFFYRVWKKAWRKLIN